MIGKEDIHVMFGCEFESGYPWENEPLQWSMCRYFYKRFFHGLRHAAMKLLF